MIKYFKNNWWAARCCSSLCCLHDTISCEPKRKANFEVDGLNLQVEYHRPYKKGRLILRGKDGTCSLWEILENGR